MRHPFACATLLLGALACSMPDTAAENGTASDDTAIRQLIDDWTTMLNLRDTTALATLVSPDYHAVTADGRHLATRGELHAMLMQEYAVMPSGLGFESATDFVAFQSPTAAFAGGRYTVAGAPGTEAPRGAWLMTFSRDSTGWQIRGSLSAPLGAIPGADAP